MKMMRHAPKVIAALWLAACGGGDQTSTAGGTGTGSGTGMGTEPVGTDGPTTAPTGVSTTDVLPTTGEAPGTTSLDPTNAFTDSSQLTEGPADDTTGTPVPPNMCEASGLCLDPGGCVECSIGADCAEVFAACLAFPNDECVKYSDCSTACQGDGPCVQNCSIQYPNGYDPSWAVFDCSFCGVCPNSCNAAAPYCAAGGGGPGKTNTCEELADCAKCSSCSLLQGCNDELNTCLADPECAPYQTCIQSCSEGDIGCFNLCEDTYPNGYANSWAAFDCATCEECPVSCAAAQPYCAAGGGGPQTECISNSDCVEIYDSLYYCVGAQCVECLTSDDCLDGSFPNCVGNFCQ